LFGHCIEPGFDRYGTLVPFAPGAADIDETTVVIGEKPIADAQRMVRNGFRLEASHRNRYPRQCMTPPVLEYHLNFLFPDR
jgi:hypothetical protein